SSRRRHTSFSRDWSSDVCSSDLVALDASDPTDIQVRGEFTLPGRIQDSRRVGDVLYLVTLEDGWCWGCDGNQKTVVTSLDISDRSEERRVGEEGVWRRPSCHDKV